MKGNKLTIMSAGTVVRGDVYSEDVLVVEGGVEGRVFGNRVIVKTSGWVVGRLACRSLCIEPGGVVDGEVKVSNHTATALTGGEPAAALTSGRSHLDNGALSGGKTATQDPLLDLDSQDSLD